jgi:hypothetical protein
MTPFETDSQGNVIVKPLTGWAVMDAAGIAVLLQIQYADDEKELESGVSRSFQFGMTPQQALELAELLTRRAKRLLEDKLTPGKSPN